MKSPNAANRRIRFRLATLLLLAALAGVAAAWWADHARLKEELRQARLENEMAQEQVDALKQRLSTRQAGLQTHSTWADADEFVQMLTTTRDDEKFLEMAPSLAKTDEEVFHESIRELNTLLGAPEARTRSRAVVTLRFMHQLAPNQMSEHVPSIVPRLVPLLEDTSGTVIGETIYTLGSLGPAANEAAGVLRKKMADDQDHYAPAAALAVAKIEPSADVGPRLAEFVRTKHASWYTAAFHLPKHTDAETAREVLTRAYREAVDASERQMVTQALNQIPARTDQDDASRPAGSAESANSASATDG